MWMSQRSTVACLLHSQHLRTVCAALTSTHASPALIPLLCCRCSVWHGWQRVQWPALLPPSRSWWVLVQSVTTCVSALQVGRGFALVQQGCKDGVGMVAPRQPQVTTLVLCLCGRWCHNLWLAVRGRSWRHVRSRDARSGLVGTLGGRWCQQQRKAHPCGRRRSGASQRAPIGAWWQLRSLILVATHRQCCHGVSDIRKFPVR